MKWWRTGRHGAMRRFLGNVFLGGPHCNHDFRRCNKNRRARRTARSTPNRIDAARTLAYDAAPLANFRFFQHKKEICPPIEDVLIGFLSFLRNRFSLVRVFVSRSKPRRLVPEKPAEKPKDEKKSPVPKKKIVQTKHSLKIGGQEIKVHTATAGTILLKLEDGTPQASIFYMAYTKDDVSDASQRPINIQLSMADRVPHPLAAISCCSVHAGCRGRTPVPLLPPP